MAATRPGLRGLWLVPGVPEGLGRECGGVPQGARRVLGGHHDGAPAGEASGGEGEGVLAAGSIRREQVAAF